MNTGPSNAKSRRGAFDRGIAAEEAAARLLVAKGLAIVARRWKSAGGEIDLIAEKPGLLVFVEVKARAGSRQLGLARAAEAISVRQMRRIAASAEAYLAEHPPACDTDIRFDAILVTRGLPPHHIEAAFDADTQE